MDKLISWFLEELLALKEIILLRKEEPDENRKQKVNYAFLVLGNILFVIVSLVFFTGGVLWLVKKCHEVFGDKLDKPLDYTPTAVKIYAVIAFLAFIFFLLRILLWLKRYVEMYNLLRIYIVLEVVLLLHSLYKEANSKTTAQSPLVEMSRDSFIPLPREPVQIMDNGKPVTAYIVSPDVLDKIEMLDKENIETNRRIKRLQKVEPVFITVLNYIKKVFDF
jgi:hypothetical protein